jgi:hypothetical protein
MILKSICLVLKCIHAGGNSHNAVEVSQYSKQ